MKRTFTRQRITRAVMTLLVTMLTAATAWADDVTLQDDNGTKYVNMPTTGKNTLTLSDATITTFKVYDDGGKSGKYSDNYSGTLTLTAPEGYVLQLSGSIMTEVIDDNLTVYDNSEASGTKLLDAVSSTGSSGNLTAITTVVSSGQSMTLCFSSDNMWTYDGLDLTVTLISASTVSGITVNNPATGGSVAATVSNASATQAKVGQTVTLTATPESGYVLSDLTVVDANSNAVAVDWSIWSNTATFRMPASAVTVTPTFTNDLTSLSINMPATGTQTATIPMGVQSFKVYDDGGKSDNYSLNYSGTLVLTAPAGYVLQLSGSIKTEIACDKLTVYDNSEASGTKLLDAVSSTGYGTETAITTVYSTGQSMTLYFSSNYQICYDGLDLTVTVINPNEEYAINVSSVTGGSVAASVSNASANTAKWNDVVTLTATPDNGYLLSDLSVTDGSSNAVAVDWNVWTNTATFTMPLSAVTVTPTFTNLTSLSVNMPVTGTKQATIPTGVTSFKVYDDGGSSGNYSDRCQGTLVLTAPEGYVLQLSGSIITERSYDKLTVYDNSEASGTKLLDAVSSTDYGTQTTINTVYSSGRSMTLYFYSDNRTNYAGLDLTVTLVSTSTDYDIILNNATGGSVTATVNSTNATTAKVNDVVTLTATPASGYLLSDLSVTDGSSNAVAVTDMLWYTNINTATFTMPGSEVTVTPTFTNDLTSLSVNMPVTGTKQATIPSGVTSFKVYDDGGKSGNYSDKCSGTLVLTAPAGYVLQLSGSITGDTWDNLTVYDGSEASGTKQLIAVSSPHYGTQMTINTVYSSGKSMTLYFKSDGVTNYAGFDLTVTLVDANTEYDINGLGATTGGSVTATVNSTNATTAKVNDVVTLTATPDNGYLLSDLSVKDADNNDVAVTDMRWYTGASSATFTMPASNVTVAPTFTNTWTAAGGLYINMPATDTKSVTIPSGVRSFKVYDDGGKSGKYSDNSSGTLTLTAPEGYKLQLSGSITTEKSHDYLTVYDNSEASGTKLLDAVSSTSSGTKSAITTVASSGQSMTLCFNSDDIYNYAGLDLTVTVFDPNAQNAITVSSVTGGSVASSKSSAKFGDNITLTASPSTGYVLSGISVMDESSNAVAVTGVTWYNNTATFTMPGSAVTVTPTFTNDLTNLYINMPKTGTQSATIPTGMTSFKVYDDGGANHFYSDGCQGTLVLTAPAGYVLKLSGNITTQKDKDKLTAYDGGDNNADKLLNAVSSTVTTAQTAIKTVTSSGQSMTLYFESDDFYNLAGLDLTVEVLKTLELANYADNITAINNNNNGMMSKVTLSDRTLLKNGDWNTLCLPFSLTAAQIAASPLAGATIMELLSTSNLNSEGKLTLNFKNVNAITAGKPYMVKWSPTTDNLTNPVFNNVTIDNTVNDVIFSGGSFKGTYAPLEITDANRNEVLLLATGNKLGYAKTDRTVANGKALGTCRAYFEIPTTTGAPAINSYELNFGEGTATSISEELRVKSEEFATATGWYTLDGRRLQGKPAQKGVYIQNGKKVIIK